MRVLILGANGQLGSDICEVFSKDWDVVKAIHRDADINNFWAARSLIDKINPDCLINTAAAHNVEKCEANPDTCYKTNALATRNLAEICREADIPFVHFSTDYVFDGFNRKPYVETDPTNPLNAYGLSKREGERMALAAWRKTIILRTGGIYGKNPCRAKEGLNFVKLMIKLAGEKPEIRVVDEEIVTPTPTKAIAEQTLALVKSGEYGLFHATCQGQCSWHEFAKTIFELAGIKANLAKAHPKEFSAKIRRPSWSVLENYNLKREGLDLMPHWHDSLEEYIKENKLGA